MSAMPEPGALAAALLVPGRRPVEPAFAAYARALPRPRPTEVVVIEDKDMAAAWVTDRFACRWRTFEYLCKDGN